MTQRVFAIVLAILVMTAPTGLFAEEQEETKSSAESYRIGQLDAEEDHGTGGWIALGVIGGGLFSWLGTGVSYLIASGSSPSPEYVPEDVKARSYSSGYSKKAKQKNMQAVAIPGVIMSTIWTVVAISAASSY
jgi:hypothetical protein